jgi:phage tail-like protein
VTELLRAFRFSIFLHRSTGYVLKRTETADVSRSGTPLGEGAFQECSGLELEMEVKEHLEGGRNDGVIQRVGRVKLQPLVLKRGMFAAGPGGYVNTDLWAWLEGVVGGLRPVRRFDGLVEVHDPRSNDVVMARWKFFRGLPIKVTGPTLNAQTGELALEELRIAHEGLRMEHQLLPEELMP